MNLLAGKLYDPAVAVNVVTTALRAMTALDATNLRLAFVVPPSGIVRVRLAGVLQGATTYPQILLGVMEGATVRGRMAPTLGGNNAAATSRTACTADFVVTGLTPGASLNWDAASGVETLVALTGLKYGGPNNATVNDAHGGFAFEIWDCCPTYTPTSGTAPVDTPHVKLDAVRTKTDFLPSATAGAAGGVFIAGTNAATAITTGLTTTFTGDLTGDVGSVSSLASRLPAALVGGRMDSSVGAVAADTITAAATAADFGTEVASAVWAKVLP